MISGITCDGLTANYTVRGLRDCDTTTAKNWQVPLGPVMFRLILLLAFRVALRAGILIQQNRRGF